MDSQKKRFLEVIDQHQGIITSLCRVYYLNADDRRDTCQDIIFQLWKSFGSFRGESKISTWVYRVSLNTVLNKRKKEFRRPEEDAISLQDVSNLRAATCDDNDQLLGHILSTLKDDDKAILILHLEGYKNQEIAELLEFSTTNVSTKLHRIKSMLRKKYKKPQPWI